ncbi:MAG: hypothetical protein EVA77_07120, partial [Phycisphaeraceae bacterium]
MLLPIALSVFGQLVTPVLSPSAPAPLPGWSWEGGFYQPDLVTKSSSSDVTPWVCGSGPTVGLPQVENLIPSDCSYNFTNPDAMYDPSNGRYVIPCVVHVITDGSVGSVDLSCVQGAIDILNNDFRAASGTPGSSGLDTQIEFFLPQVDEQGNPSTGVTFTSNADWFYETSPTSTNSLAYRDALAWDPNKYMNIYVLNIAAAGYAFLPVDPCNCIPGNRLYDGVHMRTDYFGSCGAQMSGRVLTHEVGHYLGLFHTFNEGCDSGSCNASGDRICDTNPQAEGSYGFDCNTYQSCGSADPDRNYMNYGNGSCFEDFTSDQIRRMRCVLESYRPQLGTLVFPGACCFEDGSCELATESGCADVGGTYQGEGSACEPNNCPQPPTLGACCLPDLSCSEVEASECATLGGDYKGDDSVC